MLRRGRAGGGRPLNEPFSAKLPGRFAALTLVEVIEHLENPRALLRECHKLLEPGGLLFITTPNIEEEAGAGCWPG